MVLGEEGEEERRRARGEVVCVVEAEGADDEGEDEGREERRVRERGDDEGLALKQNG